MEGTYDEAPDKLRWLMEDAEDLLAEGMELALEQQFPGTRYVTRSERWVIPAGTTIWVRRTSAMTLAAIVQNTDLCSTAKQVGNLVMVTNYSQSDLHSRLYFGQKARFIFEGLETPEELREALEKYRAGKKHKFRIPDTFEPL